MLPSTRQATPKPSAASYATTGGGPGPLPETSPQRNPSCGGSFIIAFRHQILLVLSAVMLTKEGPTKTNPISPLGGPCKTLLSILRCLGGKSTQSFHSLRYRLKEVSTQRGIAEGDRSNHTRKQVSTQRGEPADGGIVRKPNPAPSRPATLD